MSKNIRTGIYGLVHFGDKIVTIKKTRGPYTGLLDLPGGKIEYGEKHIDALTREIGEELGLEEQDFKIGTLLKVEEEYIEGHWDGKDRTEHIIGIIYNVEVLKKDFSQDYIEDGGDAGGIVLIESNMKKYAYTPILDRVVSHIKSL